MIWHASLMKFQSKQFVRLAVVAAVTWRGAIALGDVATETLLENSAFWEQSPETFMENRKADGFRWSSDQRQTARAYRQNVTFLGIPIPECEVHFEEGKPSKWMMTAYSRGENGDKSMESFKQGANTIAGYLDRWAGSSSVEMKKRLTMKGVGSEARAWVKPPHQVVMEWNWTIRRNASTSQKYRPEFLRMILTPFDPKADPRSAMYKQNQTGGNSIVRVSRRTLKKNVQRRPDGTKIIENVPMVDQGQRGYCAVATTERIMSYYGFEVDQHLMAQLAQSSAQQGTSSLTMMAALKQAGAKLDCRVKEHHRLDLKSLERTLKNYNRAAKSAKVEKIPEHVLQGPVDITAIYRAMRSDLLLEARLKQQADYKSFLRTVQQHVDKGIPVVWSIMMGKVEEAPPTQGMGGHMRLITGYNSKTSEMIYTDSWGQGHEEKRMTYGNAWMITTGVYTIEPRAMVY